MEIRPPFIYLQRSRLPETVWFVYNEGASPKSMFCFMAVPEDMAEACRRRYRALVTDMVAKHLPVVGVPELVANYTPTPFDVEQ